MRQFFFLSLMILLIASCESKKKASRDDFADNSDKKNVLKEPLDTSMLSLRASKTIAIDQVLGQDWNMEDADKLHWNELFWDSVSNKRKFPGLYLYRDGSFTENARATIGTGRWNLDKSTRQISLSFEGGEKKIYYIQQLSLNNITFVWRRNEDSVTMKFSSDNIVHKRVEDDPFYYENNSWRIKPSTSENSDQIRERVRECVHFYALFFKDNHLRQSTDISFIGLPSCFVWYNGGISLQVPIELDRKWINCFYSEDQAYRGYDMLKAFLQTKTLKWPSRKVGWVQQTRVVLEQLRDSL